MIVAFFDFDGTISNKDSFLDFVSFTKGRVKMLKGIIAYLPSIIRYKLGLLSGHVIKEKLLTHYFKGVSEETFIAYGEQYVAQQIKTIIRPKALERIRWHVNQNHEVVVVTASIVNWIKPWCDELELKCIATEVEIENQLLTGKLKGLNCIGLEKVTRIKEYYTINNLEYIYAYGNSKGDKELLDIANKKYYKYF